jgi:glycosyltransferase involved in cell wall biosynthesis
MHLAVYCDYPYRRRGGELTAEQPVALFLDQLAIHFERLTLVGRLDASPEAFPYRITNARFAALPHYSSGADPRALLRSVPAGVAVFWRLLDDADAAWVLGPTPLSLLFALLTLVRGRALILGVRQDLPRLFRHRYPRRPLLRAGAGVLEGLFRTLSRRVGTVVVGSDLARNYRHARRLHIVHISLLRERDVAEPDDTERDYAGPELTMLSVGRLDPEKNPLLLADVLAQADPRWRLEVCGDGPLRDGLARRLVELGVARRATLRGHVPIDGGLVERYRASHALIHVSHTEGVPQVLLEAFATRLPVVATAVGGVPGLVGDAGLLVPPRNAQASARALDRIANDGELRERLVIQATERARAHTLEAECARLADFLKGSG